MSKKSSDAELLSGFKTRLSRVIDEQFSGKHTRLAREAGIGPSTIQGWISNEGVNPNGLAITKVAKACGKTVEWLLTGEGPPEGSDKPTGAGPLDADQVGPGKLTNQEKQLLGKALEVLRAKKMEGAFDQALKSSIEALHAAVKNAKGNEHKTTGIATGKEGETQRSPKRRFIAFRGTVIDLDHWWKGWRSC